jgi:hypothetical protein
MKTKMHDDLYEVVRKDGTLLQVVTMRERASVRMNRILPSILCTMNYKKTSIGFETDNEICKLDTWIEGLSEREQVRKSIDLIVSCI